MRRNKHFYRRFFALTGILLVLIVAAGLALSLSACASGARQSDIYGGLGQGQDPAPFMSKVRRGTLPNGLRYYILENSRPENRAFLTLAVNAGSVLEEDDEQGLAHFVEHMAFNGTVRFPEAELISYLRSLGMRFGPEVNAHTSFDETVYGIEVPVESGPEGIKRIPEKALAVIDDWTYAITFDPKDVDEERPVIMEEYRQRLGSGERMQRKLMPVIFGGSRYEHRLPIGLPAIIQNAPAGTLEGFYRTWYRPDNMALILVGDFDGAVLEAELASHFHAPAPTSPLNRPYYELPEPQKGYLEAGVFTDPEYPNTRISLYYKRPPLALRGSLASFREGVIDTLIDRMLAFRFDAASARQENSYADAGAGEVRYGQASRYYAMVVISKPGEARESLRALFREKELMSRYGFTDTEIERTKRALISDLRRMESEKNRRNSVAYVNDFTRHFLDNQSAADIEWELDAVIKLLPGISARDITQAARAYFAADDLRVIVTAPEAERATLPAEAEIRQIVAESRRARIDRPREREKESSSLMTKTPLPGTIIAESEDPETGTIRWELDNGAAVLLKETSNKNNEIVLYALARGGVTGASLEDNISARLAGEIIEASGVGSYSRTELVRLLADKQVSIAFWLSSFYRGFQGSATTGDMRTLFELLHLGFTQPRIDRDAVGAMLDHYRTDLAQRSESPEAVFFDEINKSVWNNPYFKPLELADLPKADMNRALALVKRGLNPGDYTFVFTGNLDIPVIREYVETYLASIPRIESWNNWDTPNISRPANVEKNIYKGKEEKSLVFMGWFLPERYTDPMAAAAQVLSEYLDIVLTEEIREKLGGVYSVSIDVSLSPLPSDGELMMQNYFACDPQRAVELSAAITERIQRAAQGDINGDTFTKSVEALKKQFEQSLESNLYIARRLANNAVFFQAPLNRLNRWPGLYDEVRPADIQDMARRLLNRGALRMILYPEGWNAGR